MMAMKMPTVSPSPSYKLMALAACFTSLLVLLDGKVI
jgi:hypothetical protein